jgi:hypothetical protein
MAIDDRMRRSVLLPPAAAIMETLTVLDADLDDHGNTAFAVGCGGAATHVLFGTGALTALPKPLFSCTLRLRDRDRVLVRGYRREPDAYEVASDGTIGQSFLAVQYADRILCTQDRVVLTYYDDAMGTGLAHADQAVAIFDWEGTYLWGWNDSRDLPPLYDCDGATRLGGNVIGVFANHHYPLVVLDTGTCRPIEIYHPTPKQLHGAQAISRRDDVWCFLSPYDAKESVLTWRPQGGRPTMIGSIPRRHRFRGLPDGRLINVTDGRAEILAIAPADSGPGKA